MCLLRCQLNVGGCIVTVDATGAQTQITQTIRDEKVDRPLGLKSVSTEGSIRYRNVLGGIIRDYIREAAQPSFTRR